MAVEPGKSNRLWDLGNKPSWGGCSETHRHQNEWSVDIHMTYETVYSIRMPSNSDGPMSNPPNQDFTGWETSGRFIKIHNFIRGRPFNFGIKIFINFHYNHCKIIFIFYRGEIKSVIYIFVVFLSVDPSKSWGVKYFSSIFEIKIFIFNKDQQIH